jgi:NADPH:quinone reductase-like Zn-dependent oxidoreductase
MPGTSAVFFHTSSDKQQNRTDLMNILQLLSEGKIKPVIGARLPLGQASQAHRLLETAAVVGKIVLVTEGH